MNDSPAGLSPTFWLALLYFAALLLSVLLAYLGTEGHRRARALRRRAAFEHTLVDFSLALISTREGNIEALIRQALKDLARCIDADRAYLLLGRGADRNFAWCRPETGFALDWPARVTSLLDRLETRGEGETHIVPQISRLPEGPDHAALASLGLQGWSCASRYSSGGERSLLGFDFILRPCRVMPGGELGLMRMALDVMAGAFERRALAHDRTRLAVRLEQARRLETVGTLASGIAHNFNNIVGAILGYAEMAREQAYGDQRTDRIFADIQRAGERGRELVDEILVFARHRDKPRNPIDLRAVVSEAVSLLRASLPAEVELAVAQEDRPMAMSGVPAQLQQIILNLCNNAAQAMGRPARVDLEIAAIELPAVRTLTHGSLDPGRYTRIAVIDSGHGIDKDKLQRIFEPFFTTRTGGSGLGLATCREIVREHGGAIDVQSKVGVGTRFEVWLPLIDAAALSEPVAASPIGNGEIVLLVAGEEQVLRDEEMLAALGYEPVGFASIAQACNDCRAMPQRFDVAILNHAGPNTALLEAAAVLHEAAPLLPILVVTASGDALDADALLATGISDVLSQPLDAADVAVALAGCLRRKGVAAPSWTSYDMEPPSLADRGTLPVTWREPVASRRVTPI